MGQAGGNGVACCASRSSGERGPADEERLNTPGSGIGCCAACAQRDGERPVEPLATRIAVPGVEQSGRHSCPAVGSTSRSCTEPQADLSPLCLAGPRGGIIDERCFVDAGGGTGGTGDTNCNRSGDDHGRDGCAGIGPRFDPFSNFIGSSPVAVGCSGAVGRQALFGDKSLRPKTLRLRALEGEIEALEETRQQITGRLPAVEGANVALPLALEDGTNKDGALGLSEWVHRLLEHDAALRGMPARSVKEACSGVLGSTSRLIGLHEMKAHYVDILVAAHRLAQERIADARFEHARLDQEVHEIEEFISACFDKMSEDGRGAVTRRQFVAFVCGEGNENYGDAFIVSPTDAECLFDQMSKGSRELPFEQFKDEITHGCLQVLKGNIALRRNMLKRYRDYWF